jgi:hypothetical protein
MQKQVNEIKENMNKKLNEFNENIKKQWNHSFKMINVWLLCLDYYWMKKNCVSLRMAFSESTFASSCI